MKLWSVRLWGRDRDQAIAAIEALGVAKDHVREPEDGAEAYWFETEADRNKVFDALDKIECVVTDPGYGENSRRMTIARVVLRYGMRNFTYLHHFGFGYDPQSVRFMYIDGNYSCDCNRTIFIRRWCDASFPEFRCGGKIELVELHVGRRNAEQEICPVLH